MILDKHITVAWCEKCWIHGRTIWVKLSDGKYQCTICKQEKELPGMDHKVMEVEHVTGREIGRSF